MNNSSIVRQLKNLNKKQKKNKIESKKDSTSLISIIALVLSIVSIYLQFFYEKFDLNASLIDSDIKNDTISLNIIYHNKGNQDATILASDLYFYSDKNKKLEKNHIEFINNKQEPYILSPGKQVFKNFIQKVYFDEKNLFKNYNTKSSDTLRLALKIQYLRNNSLQSEKIAECGWITLDSLKKINYWFVKFQKIELDSDEYFSSGYYTEKH